MPSVTIATEYSKTVASMRKTLRWLWRTCGCCASYQDAESDNNV